MVQVNMDMLPMKGHYFLFNAGTAPLVPYLPTYAKQLGFSSNIVGIIYTLLPIFGLMAKPIFGAIGDRYEKHKVVFILAQIMTMCAFFGLYFLPKTPIQNVVDLSCGDGETFFHSCYSNDTTPNQCLLESVLNQNSTSRCQMACKMDQIGMWRTVCDSWKAPKFCYIANPTFKFTAKLSKESVGKSNDCVQLPLDKVKMPDGIEITPHCPFHSNCQLFCADKRIDEFLSKKDNKADLVCDKSKNVFQSCARTSEEIDLLINGFANATGEIECTAECSMDVDKWREMCLSWKAEDDILCNLTTQNLPPLLNFTGLVPMQKNVQEGNCVYFKLQQAILPDGSTHYPTCPSKPKTSEKHFHSQCNINCDNSKVNEFLVSTQHKASSSIPSQFWSFSVLMVLNWSGMAIVVSIADAICFEKLGPNANDYGRQRLWGSAGWGIFSLMAGALIDVFSPNPEYKDYTVAFIMMAVFFGLDILVSIKLKYKQKKMSVNILQNVGTVLSTGRTRHFLLWVTLVGMCTGLLWQFLFWHLEDLAGKDCNQTQLTKTLQGLVSGLQCFCGEIPFFFFSGAILKKIGHIHSMSLVLLGYGLSFVMFSFLSNPWWVLPIELLQGATLGMMYAIMPSYASLVAPSGTEATIQGLVGAVFEGVGTSIGSLVGGFVFMKYGGGLTFRIFGCGALIAFLLNCIASYKLKSLKNEEFSSIIRYAAPNEAMDMLDDDPTL